MTDTYDLIVIGAGSGGLTAARFAARLGVKVALIEKDRVGGDCTWTGCVPSKALLKAAKMAHATRTAADYGICNGGGEPPQVNMSRVRDYVKQAIVDIYQHETPEQLRREEMDVIIGAARFLDARTIQVCERTLTAKKFIITTGAHPFVPNVPGLQDVPYLTYLQLFDNDCLPERFIVMGAGPIGAEIAQAYQRLGSQVTLIDIGLLPREEPEVAEVMGKIFAREGIQFVEGLVTAVRQEGAEIVLNVEQQEFRADMLLVAVGRMAVVDGLDLDKAGVSYSLNGIPVDKYLRTNVKHIYAAGDCVAGNYQFTHLAGWQAFQAARNALLPGNDRGFREVMPWTTFTEPEVAHVGLTEAQAREKFGEAVRVTRWNLDRVDRAVCENDRDGFIKVVHKKNGKLLGVTIVAGRAGEAITEFVLALQRGLKLFDLANFIHVYPTYSMATMQLAAEVTTDQVLSGLSGKVLRGLAGVRR
jgi:pyruvate/2-oxoglutarate dehydrogenase complex dihydrolipoamide dehydrogenase (E3) component